MYITAKAQLHIVSRRLCGVKFRKELSATAERVRVMPCGGIVAFCAAMALLRFDERGKGRAQQRLARQKLGKGNAM